MNATACRLLVCLALGLAPLAGAKDEIIPTKPKTQERQGPPNPLREIADDMDVVARRLGDSKTDDLTQQKEEEVIKKLEILIELARQQQQQSGGGDGQARQRQQKKPQPKPGSQQGQGKKPGQAQQQSQSQGNSPGQGRPGSGRADGPIHTDAEEWGALPPAIRDQLLQTQGEAFPPQYRELLRRYYRELAKPRD